MQINNVLFNKAKNFHKNGEIEKAIKIYLELIDEKDTNIELIFLLGTAYLQINKLENSLFHLNNVIKQEKFFFKAYNNRAIIFNKMGENLKAIEDCEKALKLKPNFNESLINKGIALKNLKRFDEAINCFKKSISINPNISETYNNLGNIYKEIGENGEAIKYYDKSIELNSNNFDAFNNKGIVLNLIEKYEESLENYNKAITINPNTDYLLGGIIHSKMHLCDWYQLDDLKINLKNKIIQKKIVASPFILLSVYDELEIQKLNAENHINKNYYKFFKSNKKINKLSNNKKIRIGYFSGEFHKHPCLLLMKDIYKKHDKSKFEVYAFSCGPNPMSNPWRDEIIPYFNKFFDVNKKSDEEIIELSNKYKIDIAINITGLANYERTSLFAKRVAPVQVNYLGYPGTMGAEFMDYLIADRLIVPEKLKKYYNEKIIYLPDCYQPNPNKLLSTSSKKKFTRKNLGLPEKSIVYCCFNNHYKITPYIFNSWMNILKEVNESIIWIYVDKRYAQENLKKEAINRAVDPDRIKFAKKESIEDHIERMKLADIFLDTWPYNAHTTASDAIRIGLPIVTLIGNSFASRVAASILNTVKLENLIAEKIEDYENIAIELGKNKEKLTKIKDKLKSAEKKSILFDSSNFTKNLEKLFNQLIL